MSTESWVPGALLLSRARGAQLEPFKNGRNSCRPKHRGEQHGASPVGLSREGWGGLLPCLSACAKKELILGREYLLSVTRLEGRKGPV